MNSRERVAIAKRIAPQLPIEPGDEEKEQIEISMTDIRAIVYKMKKRNSTVEWCCTECGYGDEAPFVRGEGKGWYKKSWGFSAGGKIYRDGNELLRCPHCGDIVSVKKIAAKERMTYIGSQIVLTVQIVSGYITLIEWLVLKHADIDGNTYLEPIGSEAACFIEGDAVRLVKYRYVMFGGRSSLDRWETRNAFTDKITDCYPSRIFGASALLNTELSKCALDVYIKEGAVNGAVYPVQYLRIWARYPNIENIVRSGYSDKITEMIAQSAYQNGTYYNEGYGYRIDEIKRLVDVKKSRPHEMFRIEKEEMHLIREMELSEFLLYSYVKSERGIKLDRKTLEAAEGLYHHGVDVYKLFQKECRGVTFPVVHTINYISRQCEKNSVVHGRYYEDYLGMLTTVYGKIDPEMMFPKDLVEAHDRVMTLVKQKEDAELAAKIAEVAKVRAAMAWQDAETGLLIRAAASQRELCDEGEKLHHCVATYAKSHAEGRTTIFFIRKISAPDEPYFTLEYKNGRVEQNRGCHNCARTPEVVVFEKKWLEYLNTLNKKEAKKNGRKQNTADRVGA